MIMSAKLNTIIHFNQSFFSYNISRSDLIKSLECNKGFASEVHKILVGFNGCAYCHLFCDQGEGSIKTLS